MKFDFPTSAQIPMLRSLWQEAFGDTDAFLDQFFATGFSENRCRCAVEKGQAAAALYWMDCECNGRKLAYLYAVATAANFRHQGLCHALLTDTHALLIQQGYAGTILVPGSADLAGLYSDLGYRWCSQIREFSCAAASEPIGLRPIDAQEFARLRRNLLPPGAVVQEGAALDFLAAQVRFYAGDCFLLAARRDDHTLFAPELLGDAAAAPGILRALGVSEGHFRTPGAGKPFAMYRSFNSSPAPSYFAFAFD